MICRERMKQIVGCAGLSSWVTRISLRREHEIVKGTYRPPEIPEKTLLLYTTVKCASTATHRMLFYLAQIKNPNYQHINLFRYFYNLNWDSRVYFEEHVNELLLPRGLVYGPLRHGVLPENLEDFIPIVILRDPRDVLVSMYFSIRESHPLPMNPGTRKRLLAKRAFALDHTVDEFVLWVLPEFLEIYRQYDLLVGQEGVLFLTYEQFVMDVEGFLGSLMIAVGIRWEDVDKDALMKMAGEGHSGIEDTSLHIRKRTPGDYKEKLSSETIRLLNDAFAFYFEFCSKHSYGPCRE